MSRGVGWDGDRNTEIKEDKEWSLWDNVREVLLAEGLNQLQKQSFLIKDALGCGFQMKHPRVTKGPEGWAGHKKHRLTGHPFILQ